ncbi:VOC family protein [Bacillus toyonensis]|uniref:VOC family protein n=1 Tax=Bacillus toyonensis TaxID=155322 RepID=UPI0020D24C9B|nr:VOC family protein [Bacillus toyonensis]
MRNANVVDIFNFPPERQPLVLSNHPQTHAAISFEDPDGNLLEFISPLRIDGKEKFEMMELNP